MESGEDGVIGQHVPSPVHRELNTGNGSVTAHHLQMGETTVVIAQMWREMKNHVKWTPALWMVAGANGAVGPLAAHLVVKEPVLMNVGVILLLLSTMENTVLATVLRVWNAT
jgi:hypothetical protein